MHVHYMKHNNMSKMQGSSQLDCEPKNISKHTVDLLQDTENQFNSLTLTTNCKNKEIDVNHLTQAFEKQKLQEVEANLEKLPWVKSLEDRYRQDKTLKFLDNVCGTLCDGQSYLVAKYENFWYKIPITM